MARKYILKYSAIVVMLVSGILSSCIEESLPSENTLKEGEAWAYLSFAPQDTDIVVTKEAQSYATENKIVNFHLFIFDYNGNKLYGKLFDESLQMASEDDVNSADNDAWWAANPSEGNNTGGVKFKAPQGENLKIYILANLNSDAVRISADLLNANIQKETDLKAFEAYLNQETVNRISSFPMSGKMEGITIGNNDINSKWEFKLKRLDAKIHFIFKTGIRTDKNGQTVGTFTPQQWRVINVPRTTYVIEDTQDSGDVPNNTDPSDYYKYAPKYFDTGYVNFEEFPSNTESGFTFYMLENRLTPKNEEFLSYNDRSRQKKVDSGVDKGLNVNHKVTYVNSKGQEIVKDMREFVNANDFSTYVMVTGRVDMNLINDDAGQVLSGDVEYLIHLGNWSMTAEGTSWDQDKYNGITDYKTERNTSYTYTVTVNSVDNIRVEVETARSTNTENQPGAMGEITIAKEEIALCDAHYVSKTMTFHAKNFFKGSDPIADELTWAVKTPFCDGMPKKTGSGEDNPEGLDYQWVKFRLNMKDETGSYYEDKRRLYTTRVFERRTELSENTDIDGSEGLEGYHNDGVMDIIGLVKYIKEQVELYDHYRTYGGTNTSDFDNPDDFDNAKICVTAFVDEYYYPEHPLTGKSYSGLWKEFVNQPDRSLHILCSSNASLDGESRATGSVITIQQRSIRSVYNTAPEQTDLATAWGLEQTDEHEGIWTWGTWVNTGATDNFNGLRNSLRMWGLCETNNNNFVIDKQWNDYLNFEVDNDTPQLDDDKANLRYSCMTRNRDNNGDGKIDRDEIRWYTASVSQLIGLYVGEGVVPPAAKLYNRSAKERNDNTEHTYSDGTGEKYKPWMQHVISSTHSGDKPILIWAEEGISTGNADKDQEGANKYMSIRCVRNLGMAEDHALDLLPQDYIEKTVAADKTVTFSARFLNKDATRDYVSGELPVHYENSLTNYLPDKFEVYKEGTSGTSTNFENFNSNITDAINKGEKNPYCPEGWRLPNQREVAIMFYYMIGKNPDGTVTNENKMGNSMTRTRWSFGGNGMYSFKINTKFGFKCENSTITVNNNPIGAARCVRDVRVK